MKSKLLKAAVPIVLALVMLGFGLQFIQTEGVKLADVGTALASADRRWLWLGGLLAVGYALLHAQMYRASFRALGHRVGLAAMARLYLKRNFVSVFLPAGFLSSQAFFSGEISRSEGVKERDVLAASGIFAASGWLSMVVLVVPALGWMVAKNLLPGAAAAVFLSFSASLCALTWAAVSFAQKGEAHSFLKRKTPRLFTRLDGADWSGFDKKHFIRAIFWSFLVEIIGVAHVFIAVKAVGIEASWDMSIAAYLGLLVVIISSVFLRGAGAAEAMMAFVLMKFGLPPLGAVAAAVLFRFFEFWSVLALAVPVFLAGPKSLLVRVAPSALLASLGAVNILSGLSPAIPERARLLRDLLPLYAVHASAALTVVVGAAMLGTAAYLLRGLRSAWWVAAGLSAVSLVAHITKGIDYEEATLAAVALAALIYQRGEYNGKTSFRLKKQFFKPILAASGAALLLGAVGFWMLDRRHFGADFTVGQSLELALRTFFLQDPPTLRPLTGFGHEFLWLMNWLGATAILLTAAAAVRPFLPDFEKEETDLERARHLVGRHGRSPLDYFKTYGDKRFFFTKDGETFVSYKNTARFALALEAPVAPDEAAARKGIGEFDLFCKKNGLRSVYYRVPEAAAPLFRSLGKSLLPLGQEAVLDLENFSLEGGPRKSLRNAVSKMERDGFRFVAHQRPGGRLLQQLRAVSDDWLREMGRSELTFSQGVFDENELKNQQILTVEDAEGRLFAFVNLVPGGSPTEANFDLMRRTADAPGAVMDFLFVQMFLFLKERGFKTCNLGLVPFSGLDSPHTLPENLLKLAYERLPQFSDYKSLRFAKEKFGPVWRTNYVAYDSQMDLVNLPRALGRVVHVS